MDTSIQPEPSQAPGATSGPTQRSPVCSHNEWDPLEEIIVGIVDGAVLPPDHVVVRAAVPAAFQELIRLLGGQRYPEQMIDKAEEELSGLVALLQRAGVVVRRPDPMDLQHLFETPDWSSTGFCLACPRDGHLVVGDQIIETPMAWRCRHFESMAYRRIFFDYFQRGARWTAAPRPRLLDSLYDPAYRTPAPGEAIRYAVGEGEVVFDAADFTRCGRDLFVTRSNATNLAGIEWLRRHLGPEYHIHVIESRCPNPLHIDSSFIPLGPGRVMINTEYIDPSHLPSAIRGWEILHAPRPDVVQATGPFQGSANMCSLWINTNVLLLDPRRVIVEAHQTSMMEFLYVHGFDPIPCPLMNVIPFGGAFHCVTLDVRRRGALASYL